MYEDSSFPPKSTRVSRFSLTQRIRRDRGMAQAQAAYRKMNADTGKSEEETIWEL